MAKVASRIGRSMSVTTVLVLVAAALHAGSAAALPLVPVAGSPFAAGDGPAEVVIGDFDGDGDLDLATTNANSDDVTVLLGNGAGGFTEAAGSPFAAGDEPIGLVAGDVDGDGIVDLAAANHDSSDVTILLGNGSGGFTEAIDSPVSAPGGPRGIAAGDFNGGDTLDLAIANNVSDDVRVRLGNGLGDFFAGTGPFPVGDSPSGIVAGDMNGDGTLDLVTANLFSDDVTVLLGDGVGEFTEATASPFGVGDGPFGIAAADVNGDGNLDLVTPNFNAANVTLLLGDGAGSFSEAGGSPFSVGPADGPSAIVARDMDGDGSVDLAIANLNSANVTVLLGNGAAGFTQAAGSPFGGVGDEPTGIAAGDVDGDGSVDLATANNGSDDVTVLLNEPPGEAPVFTPDSPCGDAVLARALGGPTSVGVAASGPAGSTVFLSAQDLPAYATFSATAGNPATGALSADPRILDVIASFLAGEPDEVTVTAAVGGVTSSCVITLLTSVFV